MDAHSFVHSYEKFNAHEATTKTSAKRFDQTLRSVPVWYELNIWEVIILKLGATCFQIAHIRLSDIQKDIILYLDSFPIFFCSGFPWCSRCSSRRKEPDWISKPVHNPYAESNDQLQNTAHVVRFNFWEAV